MTPDDIAALIVDQLLGRRRAPLSFLEQAAIGRALITINWKILIRAVLRDWCAKDARARDEIASWIGQ